MRPFGRKREALLLALPVAMGLWALVDASFRQDFTGRNPNFSKFFQQVLFLNAVHVGFTICMLLGFPEYRAWARSGVGLARGFSRRALCVGAFLLTLCLLAGGEYSWPSFRLGGPVLSGAKWAWIFLFAVLPNHHGLAQVRGISLLYDPGVGDARRRAAEWREKTFFTGLIGVHSLMPGILFFPRSFAGLKPWFPALLFERGPLFALSLALIGAVLTNTALSPGHVPWRKLVFQLRLLLFPMAYFYPVAAMGVACCHGLEYTLVFLRMRERSQVSLPGQSARFLKLFGIFMALFLIVNLPTRVTGGTFFAEQSASPPTWLVLFSAISSALALMHYYLDRQLFRMRDPGVRITTGALLAGASEKSGESRLLAA